MWFEKNGPKEGSFSCYLQMNETHQFLKPFIGFQSSHERVLITKIWGMEKISTEQNQFKFFLEKITKEDLKVLFWKKTQAEEEEKIRFCRKTVHYDLKRLL